MPDIVYALLALILAIAMVVVMVKIVSQSRMQQKLALHFGEMLEQLLEQKHRAMLNDLHSGLAQQSDRLSARLATELTQTRESLHRFQLSLGANLGDTTDRLNAKIDERLEQIAGRVNERLDEGFRKTNETFVSVMQRLATIDEAQKKIDTLTGSVVSLQELLGEIGRASCRERV